MGLLKLSLKGLSTPVQSGGRVITAWVRRNKILNKVWKETKPCARTGTGWGNRLHVRNSSIKLVGGVEGAVCGWQASAIFGILELLDKDMSETLGIIVVGSLLRQPRDFI